MKIIFSPLLLLIPGIAGAQLSAGTQGLSVMPGTVLSVDSLVMVPSQTTLISNNLLQRSATAIPVSLTSTTISRVYQFSQPQVFNGPAGFYYLDAELAGNIESKLQLIYSASGTSSFLPAPGSTVNTTTNYISAAFPNTSLSRISAVGMNSISGNVYNDINGLNGNPANTINGTGTNAGGLIVVLINAQTDTVMAYQPIAANGSFMFAKVWGGNYKLRLTAATVSGSSVPPAVLPAGWVYTGEFLGAGAGNDGTANGDLVLGIVAGDVTNARFGIQQAPLAGNSTIPAQLNPGGNTSVSLPNNKFIMSDAAPGAVTRVFFPSFPQGGDRFYVNNVSYTAQTWPGSGVEVTTFYLFGNLLTPNVSIDPKPGTQTVLINYQAVDAAGTKSNIATITMPFFGITIGGLVHNNTDGLNGTPSNTIMGTGTNAGGLYAILSDEIENRVVASVPVNAGTGAFTFADVDQGYYAARLSTVNALPGAVAPSNSIPSGWRATGEKNGNGPGTDGYADSKMDLGLQSSSNTNIHFGIQQPPMSIAATAAAQVNPGGSIAAVVPPATFVTSDPAPGAVTFLYFKGALPAGANKLVLNGMNYTATNPLPPEGVYVPVSNGVPSTPISVDPVNGNVTVAISYQAVDASGMMSAVTTGSQPFTINASTTSESKNGGSVSGVNENTNGSGISVAQYNISIYPNPTSERVYIKALDFAVIKELSLLDIGGRVLSTQKDNFANGVDMSNRTSGTYILKVIFHNGQSKDFKVIRK